MSGLIVLFTSLLVGFIGTVWNVCGSFGALADAESVGIGPVGASIFAALIFSIAGLIGTIVGVSLIIFGKILRDKRNR
jgi:biopolymer transport protein ExbB/TolQ